MGRILYLIIVFGNELNVHHLHYKTLGNEDIGDLVVLCKRCHNDYHFFKEFNRGEKKTT